MVKISSVSVEKSFERVWRFVSSKFWIGNIFPGS